MGEAFKAGTSSRDRDAWLKERTGGIGASEIAAVLGESPWDSPLSVYQSKVAPCDDEQDEFQFWGLELEPAIASGYSKRTGRPHQLEGRLIRSVEHPWAICTLDALTQEGAGNTIRWPLELKNVIEWKVDEWQDGAPRHVYLQAQQQMLVTDAPRCTVAALLGGNCLVWEDIERDEQEIRRIIVQGERFWREHVLARRPPPADGHRATKDALLKLHPEAKVDEQPLPASMCALDSERLDLKAQEKAIAKRLSAIENELRAAIGDAQQGRLPDGTVYSWKLQTRKAHTVKESTTRVLRRHAPKE